MAMPSVGRRWTAKEVRQLIEESPAYGPRYELIDGELLVTPAPAPPHQLALAWLYDRIAPYVRRERLGTTLWSPADIELAPEQLTQPDLFVVPQLPERPPRSWSEITQLVLAIEALSPGTARNDRNKKRPYYQRVGVPEYWMIDTAARKIERWRPSDEHPELLGDTLTWHPAGAYEPLHVGLAELWRVTGT
jgi:Uma2 family endonuclease